MTARRGRLGLLAIAAVWMSGCGSFPLPKVYVLGDPGPPVSGVSTDVGSPGVELRTVTVPDDLDSTDIIRRTERNQMLASTTGRWGERVSVGITQALLIDLSRRLPHVAFANRSPDEPSRRLIVTVQRFEIEPGGRCILTARWRVDPPAAKILSTVHEGTFVEAAASNTDSAAAAAMTAAIESLSAQIALTVEESLASRKT